MLQQNLSMRKRNNKICLNNLKRIFYKDGTRELHYGKIVSSIVFIILLISIGLCNRSKKTALKNERLADKRYIIGIIERKYQNFRSSQPSVKYYFKVLGKEYSDFEPVSADIEESITSGNARYYVEFSAKNPSNNKLLLNRPVPDSIKKSPLSGWSFTPGYE